MVGDGPAVLGFEHNRFEDRRSSVPWTRSVGLAIDLHFELVLKILKEVAFDPDAPAPEPEQVVIGQRIRIDGENRSAAWFGSLRAASDRSEATAVEERRTASLSVPLSS